ncbi:MAG: glycosyltransferase [Opitutaceae bacterium]|nr:glycosyltransferase [Opitutaceae bacterium]
MKIAHFTNTFLPHVGGVARAVQTLLEDQRRARHRVLVVAPEFDEGPAPARIESSVVRIPAFTHFNDSDFSVSLPFATLLSERLADFRTDLIHTHHPFLLGDTALREASTRQVPIVFTHHTLYENYVHYLPVDGEAMAEFAADVATRFANRCTAVIAPSQSVSDLIRSRGVTVPVHVIPTGIDTQKIATGRSIQARDRWDLPARAPVIGHLGRFAAEKNLPYLAEAITLALKQLPLARALLIGDGPVRADLERIFKEGGVASRVVFTGKLGGAALRDACAAMTVFAFSSTSETQGLVLAEAMAAGAPVVALDASGVREVVVDGTNGHLLPADTPAARFAQTLTDLLGRRESLGRFRTAALATAAGFDRSRTSARMLDLYSRLIAERREQAAQQSPLEQAIKPMLDRIATEGHLIADKTGALVDALTSDATDDPARVSPPAASEA